MTPLAARMYSEFTETNTEAARSFEASQFFECSAIMDMACHAFDLERGVILRESKFSKFAQLPAPKCVIEFIFNRIEWGLNWRVFLLCSQDGDSAIEWSLIGDKQEHGKPGLMAEGGFVPGGGLTTKQIAYVHKDETQERREALQKMLGWFNVLLEKILLIINQPNLIEKRKRSFDKRVIRRMGKKEKEKSPILFWSECRIKGGLHKKVGERPEKSLVEMPLHYVRKYYKPTRNIWVDGYWRGNADLGIHMKVYSPQPPGNDLPFMS